MKFLLLVIVLFTLQEEGVKPDTLKYIALAANAIIAGVGVQLVKWKLIPWLKTSAPYMLPVVGMIIGIASAAVMSSFGIDLTPLGDVFGVGVLSGALASSGFSMVKEVDNKRKEGL